VELSGTSDLEKTTMSTQQPPASTLLSALVIKRQQVAIGLAFAGVILAALAIWFGVWGFARSAERSAAPATPGKLIPEEVERPKEEPGKDAGKQRSPDYQVACIWAGGLALLTLLSALWVFTQPVDPAAPEAAARKELLAFGGTAGFLTVMAGIFLGYRWHQSLVLWIGGGDTREAKWVLYAAAIFLAGLLIMFVSLQLARTEQRANAALRRVLYGFNTAFVGLLLLLVLIVLNVALFVKMPKTLVVNDSAFTGLSEESRHFLRALDRPVHAYLILPENHAVSIGRIVNYTSLYSDCRGLLSQCEDETRNFKAVYLSPSFDSVRIATLMQRLNVREADRDQLGMLITVGEDEAAYTFIPALDLVDVDQGSVVFQGENKLMTELMFLSDARGKEKVYFTQGHGELTIEPGSDPARSASEIVRYLRDRKMTVETLDFTGPDAKVPDDAALVVIAGPQRPFTEDDPVLTALRAYVRRTDRPGKVLAFLPATRADDGSVAPSGLETLMSQLGADIDSSHRLVTAQNQIQLADRRFMPQDHVAVGAFPRIDISLGRAIGKYPLFLQNAREVKPAEPMPGVQRKVTPLFGTAAGMVTWKEDGFRENLITAWNNIRTDPGGVRGQIAARKQLKFRDSFPVAVASVESSGKGDKAAERPRAIVFGSDSILIDQPQVPAGIEEVRHQLVSDCVDWLRERDTTIGVAPRKLPVFILEKPVDWSSQLVLLLMIAMGIAVVGGGVWLSRRR
jgi:hypothetical protein